jgi:hypothetical protein
VADSNRETAVGRIVGRLFDGLEDGVAEGLAREVAGWLTASPRFRAFVEENGDKIRKKLRSARDPEARRDVRAELRVASLLLADRRFDLDFEPYGSGKAGPDFGVTHRGESRFNLEVTRVRRVAAGASLSPYVLAKLHQMPPSLPNALAIAIENGDVRSFDVATAILSVRARADRKDEAFFADRGLGGSRRFYERFLRLGAVYVWAEAASGEGRVSLWVNRSARIQLPSRAARACLECLRAE